MANEHRNQQQANSGANNDPSEVENLKAQLAASQAANEELRLQASKAAEMGSGGPRGPRELSTTTTKPMWPFTVKVTNYPKIAPQTINAVDEGEAIRLFVLQTKDDDGKPLDSVKCRFSAVCIDPKREYGAKAIYVKRYEDRKDMVIPQLT